MKTRQPAKITAAELLTKLRADPKYVADQEARDHHLAARSRLLRREEGPLLDDLRAVGVDVDSVWDLVNTAAKYEPAIPVLLKHLKQSYSDTTREGIARALAVAEAREAWPTLIAQYLNIPDNNRLKDGLAVAIAAIATNDVMDELIQAIRDPSHGPSRLLLLKPLRRSRNPAAKQALEELATDPDLAREINSWRGTKLKASH